MRALLAQAGKYNGWSMLAEDVVVERKMLIVLAGGKVGSEAAACLGW